MEAVQRVHPVTKASLEISNDIRPVLRSPGRRVRLIESLEVANDLPIVTNADSAKNVSQIISICKNLQRPIEKESASKFVINKKVSLKLIHDAKTYWRVKQPNCPLFKMSLDMMNYDEKMEMYRLTATYHNMSVYFVESFYNNLFTKIPMSFTESQIESIRALYPELDINLEPNTQINVYTVDDRQGKNYFATDFVYNSSTMRTLELRDNNPKTWERKDIDAINNRIVELESYLKAISINEYSLKYVSDMLLYYLGIKLPEVVRIDYKADETERVRDLKNYAFKTVTGSTTGQLIYNPSTYFLYRNIKYENIELFVLRNLLRGGPKNYANLLAINIHTNLNITLPTLAQNVTFCRSKNQTVTISREKFIKQTMKYYKKIFRATLDEAVFH